MNEHDKHLDDRWADPNKLQVEIQCQICEEVYWKNMGNQCRTCNHYGKWGNYYNITLARFDENFNLVEWNWPKEYDKAQYVFYVDKGSLFNNFIR